VLLLYQKVVVEVAVEEVAVAEDRATEEVAAGSEEAKEPAAHEIQRGAMGNQITAIRAHTTEIT